MIQIRGDDAEGRAVSPHFGIGETPEINTRHIVFLTFTIAHQSAAKRFCLMPNGRQIKPFPVCLVEWPMNKLTILRAVPVSLMGMAISPVHTCGNDVARLDTREQAEFVNAQGRRAFTDRQRVRLRQSFFICIVFLCFLDQA